MWKTTEQSYKKTNKKNWNRLFFTGYFVKLGQKLSIPEILKTLAYLSERYRRIIIGVIGLHGMNPSNTSL